MAVKSGKLSSVRPAVRRSGLRSFAKDVARKLWLTAYLTDKAGDPLAASMMLEDAMHLDDLTKAKP